MTRNVTFFTFALLSIGLPAHAAQEAPKAVKDEFKAACQSTVDAALARIQPRLGDHPTLRDKKDLVVVMPVSNFNAWADDKHQRILLPVMWCVELWYATDAWMDLNNKPKRVERYLSYLSSREPQKRKQGFDESPLRSYYEYSGIEPPILSSAEREKQQSLKEQMIEEGLAFVLAHEIGHLALKHKSPAAIEPKKSRAQERAADRFAADLLKASKVSVLSAMLTLSRFLEREPVLTGGNETSHPEAGCRLADIVLASSEVDELMKQPARRADFERASGLSAAEYKDNLARIREGCEK
jgi:hypothetical protein